MWGSNMSFSRNIEAVYCLSVGTAVGKKEKEGPLGKFFDVSFEDDKCGTKNFESGEIRLFEEAYDACLRKSKLKKNDIDMVIAGDLTNQLACSSKGAVHADVPFVGVYGACSTSMLGTIFGSLLINSKQANNVIVGATSSYATAERQFRYPQEYGLPKKDSVTTTVTGSAMLLLSANPSKVKVTKVTIGEVCSPDSIDTTDMGTPMALAAYKTIKDHLKNNNERFSDYDLIITGDLSKVGTKMLKALFKHDGLELNNHNDCGLMIYDLDRQKVFSGGSGTGCCPLVTYTYIFDKLARSVYKRVLIVATGALHDPVYVYQRKTIPTIAHAVVFERSDD